MNELLDIYTKEEISSLLEHYTLEEIIEYSKPEEVEIGKVKDLIKENEIFVESPDGFVGVGEFVDKGEYDEYLVSFEGINLSVNENHLFETDSGWEFTKDLCDKEKVKILHKDGSYKEVKITKTGKKIPIVDIQVLHENHRYYTEGLSSHNTNTGKSAMMCYLCGEFLRRGLNVLYISLEMAEEDVQERIEANLLNVSTDELKKLTKEQYMGKIRNLQSKTNGKFVAKEYPTSAGHVGHFRHLIKELKQKKKFEPDFIFVDYINICASYRISAQGSNSYSYIKAIAEELRGLSMEMNTPIMTATQVNRSGMDKSPEMTDTSDSFGLPMSLDFFISLSQNEVHQENGQQLINCIKTRWGNKSKIKPELVNIDWDKMRYSDIDSATSVASKVGNNKPNTSKNSGEGSTGSSLRDKKKRKGSSAEFQWE